MADALVTKSGTVSEISRCGMHRPEWALREPSLKLSMEKIPPEHKWYEVSKDSDIDELMGLFGHFHDGCVREVHVAAGHFVGEDLSMTVDWHTTVHLLVQRQIRRFPPLNYGSRRL